MSYRVGRGGMLEGLDEALAGMSAGDDKTFSSQLVGGDLVGEDVQVQVKVSQVQEQQLPELDDEFAQLASEFDTADELTADVRTRLGNGKRLEQAAAARDAVLEKLLEQVEVPLPETMVADELTERRQQHRAAARLRRHHAGEVPRGRGPDPGGVRGRPRAPRPRRRRRAVRPRQDRQRARGRRRPEGAHRAHGAARPAVRSGPAGVRQPHVRAQPHPRAGRRDPPRQGARRRSWRARPSPTAPATSST